MSSSRVTLSTAALSPTFVCVFVTIFSNKSPGGGTTNILNFPCDARQCIHSPFRGPRGSVPIIAESAIFLLRPARDVRSKRSFTHYSGADQRW